MSQALVSWWPLTVTLLLPSFSWTWGGDPKNGQVAAAPGAPPFSAGFQGLAPEGYACCQREHARNMAPGWPLSVS